MRIAAHEADPLLAVLPVNHVAHELRSPILGSHLWLFLGAAASDHRHLGAAACLRRESVVVGYLVLHQLLHVVSAASVDPLRVAFVGIVAVFAHPGVSVGVRHCIVSLLLHLLVELVKGRRLFEGGVGCLCGLLVYGLSHLVCSHRWMNAA